MLTRARASRFTIDDYDETCGASRRRQAHLPRGAVLLDELARLGFEDPTARDPGSPSSCRPRASIVDGEHDLSRSGWRKKDGDGALRVRRRSRALGLVSADARASRRSRSVTTTSRSPTRCSRHASLPNGLGVDYPDADGVRSSTAWRRNELTSTGDRDWIPEPVDNSAANIEAV